MIEAREAAGEEAADAAAAAADSRLTRRTDPGLSDTPWLVVGLGNPGPQYAGTRHNIGAMAVEALAGSLGGGLSAHRRCRAEVFEGRLGPLGHGATRVVLARSRGFMNESGGPVSCLMEFYKVPLEQLVVLHDELDLPLGGLRIKQGGGDNGHNGLRSLRRSLDSGEFQRIRLGHRAAAGSSGSGGLRPEAVRGLRADRGRPARGRGGRRRRGAGAPGPRAGAEPVQPLSRCRTAPLRGRIRRVPTDAALAAEIAREAGVALLDLRARFGPIEDDGPSPGADGRRRPAGPADPLRPADRRSGPRTRCSRRRPTDSEARLGAERVWIIDPLDGTDEYGQGRTDFAVHVALWQRSAGAVRARSPTPSWTCPPSVSCGAPTNRGRPTRCRRTVRCGSWSPDPGRRRA